MDIRGLQKLTLLDFPGKVACTAFLGGCDLRCPYCHNFELVAGPLPARILEEDLFAFLEKRRGLLDGVAVTGGEPCLQPDLPAFLARIRDAGFAVKLDTNGTSPRMLARLLDAGLVDYVAMDVKNSPARYARTCGVRQVDLGAIDESIGLLLRGDVPFEFRTTLVAGLHGADDIDAIGRWIAGAPRWFLQPFAESDAVPARGLAAPDAAGLQALLGIAARHVPAAALRGVDA